MRHFGVVSGRGKHVIRILRAILSEIFEESAYARFLQRHGLDSSRTAYALFLQESETQRGRRVRCC